MAEPRKVEYFHPAIGHDGKRLSTANIIWAPRDRGDAYYRVSQFGMKNGKFPATHPCAPFDGDEPGGAQMGGSKQLTAFRQRGYWASCFPEGDGITFQWWDVSEPSDKTMTQVVRDIEECFGWKVVAHA